MNWRDLPEEAFDMKSRIESVDPTYDTIRSRPREGGNELIDGVDELDGSKGVVLTEVSISETIETDRDEDGRVTWVVDYRVDHAAGRITPTSTTRKSWGTESSDDSVDPLELLVAQARADRALREFLDQRDPVPDRFVVSDISSLTTKAAARARDTHMVDRLPAGEE